MKLRDAVREPWSLDWLWLLRQAERRASRKRKRASPKPGEPASPVKPRIGMARTLGEEILELSQEPFLEFPASNVAKAEYDPGSRKWRVVVRFLGMFGPQGALPLTTTDEALNWVRANDEAFARFVDLFQRRFLGLYFRAWANSHPIAQNDRPSEDRFRVYIGSMIGVGSNAYHRADDPISEFSKMKYAGLLAPRVKSASRLRSFLSGLLGARVEIDEFVGVWLEMEPAERTRLGDANSRLGEDCMLGASLYSVSDKFRVRVFARDLAEFETLLPGTPMARELAEAIYLYLGFEYDWDLEIAIPARELRGMSLGGGGATRGGKLGWTSWMAPAVANDDQTMRTDARFHVVSRLDRDRSAKS